MRKKAEYDWAPFQLWLAGSQGSENIMLSFLRIGYRGAGFNYKCLCPLSSNAIWLDTVRALCGACCAVNNSSTTETHYATKEKHASPEPRIPACSFNKKGAIYICGRETQIADEMWFIFPILSWNQVTNKASLGRQLSACPTLPGFPFLCRRKRIWGGPEGNSGLEDGHRRAVRQRNRINSLDHHLHVLPHRASLAEALNGFQERNEVSCQNSCTFRTAKSRGKNNLGGRKQEHSYFK